MISQTVNFLLGVFPAELTGLTISYLTSNTDDIFESAEAGVYEKCLEAKDIITINTVFLKACFAGHYEIAKLMMLYGATDYEGAFARACGGGHISIARALARFGILDLNYAMYLACRHSKPGAVNYLINIGSRDWKSGFFGACEGGAVELAKKMMERDTVDLDTGFKLACGSGSIAMMDFVALMMPKPLKQETLNEGLRYACRHGHIEVARYLVRVGARHINSGLYGACEGNHPALIAIMKNMGATYCDYCFREAHQH